MHIGKKINLKGEFSLSASDTLQRRLIFKLCINIMVIKKTNITNIVLSNIYTWCF